MSLSEGGTHSVWNRLSVCSFVGIAAASFWSTAVVECAAVLAVTGSIFHWKRSRELARRFRVPLILWISYLIAVIVSVIASPYRAESLSSLSIHWHALLFPAFLLTQFTRRDMTFIATTMISSAALAAVVTILHRLVVNGHFIDPYFIGVTTFADLAVLTLLVDLGFLLLRETESPDAISNGRFIIVSLIPIAISVFWSTLKGPVIALVMGSFGLVSWLRPRALVWWAVGVVLLVALSPDVLLQKMEWFATGGNLDRYTLWDAGRSLLPGLPPFGYGPGSFHHILPAEASLAFTGKPPSTWHNDYLQTALESGWVVGVLYVAFVAVVGARLLVRPPEKKGLRIMLVVILSCFVFFSTIGSVLTSSILSVVWWCTLGIIAQFCWKDFGHEFTQ
ncbi:MAG TPA: O-antigen ligase family protein [Bacteroidota bacterium]|nr:O-antigen ligase family protein [Bacteroidota bacterium]